MTCMDKFSVLKIAKSLPKHFTAKGIEFILTDFENQKGLVYRNDNLVLGFLMYYSNQTVVEIGNILRILSVKLSCF